MKPGIHPTWYPDAVVTCACGNTWTTGSTKKEIHTDVCSKCHPFFTGEQRIVDTAGQVERFMKRITAKEQFAATQPAPEEKRAKKEKRRERKLLPTTMPVQPPAELPLAVVEEKRAVVAEPMVLPTESPVVQVEEVVPVAIVEGPASAAVVEEVAPALPAAETLAERVEEIAPAASVEEVAEPVQAIGMPVPAASEPTIQPVEGSTVEKKAKPSAAKSKAMKKAAAKKPTAKAAAKPKASAKKAVPAKPKASPAKKSK